MVTFTISMILLVIGYFVYGRIVEKVFGIKPERKTPVHLRADGVDYIPLSGWRIFLIQFLNIAGLGPIFGAIMGAKFGTSAYLWIVFGCIFVGSAHDYFSGMLSLRHHGESYPEIIGRYMYRPFMQFVRIFSSVMMILVGAVFVAGPAGLLAKLTQDSLGLPFSIWAAIIFLYFIAATVLPIDKLIGRFYPLFGAALLFMAVGILVSLYIHMPELPEITDGLMNTHPKAETTPLFPILFITIACGAVSGFHATQSPMMARCMTSERQGRPVFFGAMIVEGMVALIWAAAANFAFHTPEGRSFFTSDNAALVVNFVSQNWLGALGGALAVLGVVAAPITSGDTAFRSARLIIADALKIDQRNLIKRLMVSLPLFAIGLLLMFIDFSIVWRYFAWTNQILATITLWTVTIYLTLRRKNHWFMLIPALFMTAVVTGYFFMAPETLGLSERLALPLTFATTAVILFSFIRWKWSFEKRYPVNRHLQGNAQ
ncbi:MAG: carbon starvation protein A [Oxalobacter sp.]